MQFQNWLHLNESTLIDLYQSTTTAFPRTTKRQFVTDSVKIVELAWTPFLGVKTLFIKGEAVNAGRHYQPMILFKDVRYYPKKDHEDLIEIAANGKHYILEKLQYNKDILLRCNCPDFRWRFAYYNHLDKSLYGSKPRTYESKGGEAANPLQLPGMCKHLLKLVTSLDHSGIMEGR